MDRREFLRLSLAAPLLYGEALAEQPAQAPTLFPLLKVGGSYREIGERIGRAFGGRIRAVIEGQGGWHAGLLHALRTPHGRVLSGELKRLTRSHFPQFLEELEGVADGAGMHFDAIWAMTVKSELGAAGTEPPGCSTLYFGDGKSSVLCHNEDGHAAYLGNMVLLRVTPPSRVRFVSMVYPGILTGNGPSLNSRGVVQTTNYISTLCAEAGLPRYVVGRAILEAAGLDEAVQIATLEPRAHPYHHNLGSLSDGRYLSVETVPGQHRVEEPHGLYLHTNHLLNEGTRDYPHEDPDYVNTSSLSRYAVLEGLLAELGDDPAGRETLLAMLSSHEGAPYSPCRHPAGEVRGQTLGTACVDLKRGVFHLYSGNPCEAVPRQQKLKLGV